jgi:hypothetical protein
MVADNAEICNIFLPSVLTDPLHSTSKYRFVQFHRPAPKKNAEIVFSPD